MNGATHSREIHLVGVGARAPCGAIYSTGDIASEMLEEVTCAGCTALATKLATMSSRVRRNGRPTSGGNKGVTDLTSVLEELHPDGVWRFFDLKRWLREATEGEYAVTLRVRQFRRGARRDA